MYSVHTDERDAIQKKTFTKWVNKHLIKVNIENNGCDYGMITNESLHPYVKINNDDAYPDAHSAPPDDHQQMIGEQKSHRSVRRYA